MELDPQAFFEALNDPIRRQILALLLIHDERCVCDLNAVLEAPQPKVPAIWRCCARPAWCLPAARGSGCITACIPELPAWARAGALAHEGRHARRGRRRRPGMQDLRRLNPLLPQGNNCRENRPDPLHRQLLPFPDGRSAGQPRPGRPGPRPLRRHPAPAQGGRRRHRRLEGGRPQYRRPLPQGRGRGHGPETSIWWSPSATTPRKPALSSPGP
jgi:hypothetical protein